MIRHFIRVISFGTSLNRQVAVPIEFMRGPEAFVASMTNDATPVCISVQVIGAENVAAHVFVFA